MVCIAAATACLACRSGRTASERGAAATFVPVVDDRWPDVSDDLDAGSFAAAAGRAAAFFDGLPADRIVRFGVEERSAGELAAGLRHAGDVVAGIADPGARLAALRADFVLLASAGRNGRGEVLITGYYEPLLEARRRPEPPFVHPVYEVPPDLVSVDLQSFGVETRPESLVGRVADGVLVPYPERAAIDRGEGLPEGTGVLGWVADRVDLYFLHVQGSGTLVFEDGERLRAGFAASNGREYVSIGRVLIDEGAIPAAEMSMQAIRGWLADHPADIDRILWSNPRYVFFRPLPADDGPLGCFGTPLVAGRSIATDRRVLEVPVPALLTGTLPTEGGGDRPFARLVVNQDTGSSIVGPGRVDLFFGAGDAAGALAGRTAHLGRLYVLLPRR